MISIPNTREISFCPELILSLGWLDDEFARLFGDDSVFIDIFGKNVIIVIGDFVRVDMNNSASGSLGHKVRVITR
jgi:hypothetical protein